MKYIKAVICVVLVALLLSGCNFRISSSIDDLISPISPFGDYADVKEALDRFASDGYTLKTPNYGNNISSYNFYDIDKDGTEEAVAFYEPSDKLGTINLALIKKTGKQWSVVSNVVGIGREVHSLDFAQLNGDGNIELAVCWDAISSAASHELAVYKYVTNDKPELQLIGEPKTINTCLVTDIFNNGEEKLLLFTLNSGGTKSPKVELYSLTGDDFYLMGESKLDGRIGNFTGFKSEVIDGITRVYTDAVSSDGNVMITELLYWSEDYNSVISPFYSYSSARTEDTTRTAMVQSMDVDGDSYIEIPVDYSFGKLPKEVNAIEFMDYRHSILIHNSYALAIVSDKYVFIVPQEYISDVSVKYNEKKRELVLKNKDTKNTVLSIMPVLKATYEKENYPGYNNIFENSGYCYLAKSGKDENIKFTTEEITKLILAID